MSIFSLSVVWQDFHIVMLFKHIDQTLFQFFFFWLIHHQWDTAMIVGLVLMDRQKLRVLVEALYHTCKCCEEQRVMWPFLCVHGSKTFYSSHSLLSCVHVWMWTCIVSYFFICTYSLLFEFVVWLKMKLWTTEKQPAYFNDNTLIFLTILHYYSQ